MAEPVDLGALHAVLPLMADDAELYGRYAGFLRRLRAAAHPSDAADLRPADSSAGTLEVDLADDEGAALYYGPASAAAREAPFLAALGPDDTVVDLGAGFGLTTVGVGRVVAAGAGAVVAFEVCRSRRRLLERNVDRHGLAARVRVVADRVAGLGGADGEPAPALAANLAARGVTRVDVVRIADQADAAAGLAGAAALLQAAPDPLVRLDFGSRAAGRPTAEALAALPRLLGDDRLRAYLVDGGGGLAEAVPSPDAAPPAVVSALLVREGGEREAMLRRHLATAPRGEVRSPRPRRADPGRPDESPALPTTLPLITALAVARLRELDAITGLMSLQAGRAGSGAAGPDDDAAAASWASAAARDDEIFALQSEIERLLRESAERLEAAREARREAKALRARYEVVGGQRLRDVAGWARQILAGRRSRRD